jgi:hypothetical protein
VEKEITGFRKLKAGFIFPLACNSGMKRFGYTIDFSFKDKISVWRISGSPVKKNTQ